MICKTKTLFFFLLILITIPFACFAQELEGEKLSCSDNYSYLVISSKGTILDEKRAENIQYPASLTKLMTVYLAFEALEKGKLHLNQKLTASERAEYTSSINKVTTLNLVAGDQITVKTAIQGSIVKSFNETTVMLAEAIAGSEWKFAKMMNQKARELGMYFTNFRNASGLHEEGHFSTDYDFARLVLALKNRFPKYYNYFSIKKLWIDGKEFTNHNDFLFDYLGAEGMKTGFTSKAGYNLVAAARKKDVRLFSILMSCAAHEKRDQLTANILDKSFANVFKGNYSTIKVDSGSVNFNDHNIKRPDLNNILALKTY